MRSRSKKFWFPIKNDILFLTSQEDWWKGQIQPPKKNPRANGDFSVSDTDVGVSYESALPLSEWSLCIREGYISMWGGSSWWRGIKNKTSCSAKSRSRGIIERISRKSKNPFWKEGILNFLIALTELIIFLKLYLSYQWYRLYFDSLY